MLSIKPKLYQFLKKEQIDPKITPMMAVVANTFLSSILSMFYRYVQRLKAEDIHNINYNE